MKRGIRKQNGPSVSSGGRLGGPRPIVIENIITLDVQIIDKRIRKVASEDIGLHIARPLTATKQDKKP